MAFNEMFEYTGGFGLYQLGLFLLINVATVLSACQCMSMIFMGPDQDHWCKVEALQNVSDVILKSVTIPAGDQCHYYNLPYGNLSMI